MSPHLDRPLVHLYFRGMIEDLVSYRRSRNWQDYGNRGIPWNQYGLASERNY